MRVTNGNALTTPNRRFLLTASPNWTGLSIANNHLRDVARARRRYLAPVWRVCDVQRRAPRSIRPENPVSGLVLTVNQTTEVDFGKYCTCTSGGKSIAFWTGTTGRTKLSDGTGMASKFKLLNGAYLRRSNGLHFDLILDRRVHQLQHPGRMALGRAASSNIAYKLSTQLAAMKLNVEAGYVNTANVYKPYGDTIAQLIIDANTLLGNTELHSDVQSRQRIVAVHRHGDARRRPRAAQLQRNGDQGQALRVYLYVQHP